MTATPGFDEGWRFNKILGTGGFGVVELWNHRSDAKLAIKKCKWSITQLTETQRKRWIKEVQIMKCLEHKNIVKALELPFKYPDETIELPILCMEYCRRGNLRKVLNIRENCCGVTEKEAINVMKDISSAVEYLHSKSITHRDLKPENIVLQEEHDNITYKLIDLGYAKELGEASISASIVGTLNYVAPELLWKQKYSCSVDYWSLGILFYELVTGTRPFLPKVQHTMTWMQHIKNKGYNDICVFESEGKIIFHENIPGPTNLSRCLRKRLVEWFRVALQWDPKKRGRKCNENGEMELVVFKLLNSILSVQIIKVFSPSRYEINEYEIDSNTSVIDIQSMIEKDTEIPINEQILTDYFGKCLIAGEISLLSQIQVQRNTENDPVLFVFKTENTFMENTPALDIPKSVLKMIELSKSQLDFDVLEDYYRAAIFLITQERYLFQLYIFALTIKIFNTFNENVTNALTSINDLSSESLLIQQKWENEFSNTEKMEALKIKFEKVTKLAKAADQIKLKFDSLMQECNELKNKAEMVDCSDISLLRYKAVKIFELHKNENSHKGVKPTEMVKLIFEFFKVRQVQFDNENISEIMKHIAKLEIELLTLERIFDSVIAMLTVYREDLQNITQCTFNRTPRISNNELPLNTSVVTRNEIATNSRNNDTKMSNEFTGNQSSNTSIKRSEIIDEDSNLIYDNIVLRYTLDNLLIEMQKKYMEMVTLEP
ncbi:inhibitor of nuclear factor kappa-B kinase subunit alpha-like isoform X2 [Colletes gigas]|uniref:inhibitor of nuclear factor kappa-B kinase subunit alpha-like isoform X2 n=1 Tax=Colletes gigas TaxID=935657 RepID=UPI001C9A6F52|nr:inhibitor of nuclear factor kappa-B kinase subunit alpha-like isoform X2 [Colletes gigas]